MAALAGPPGPLEVQTIGPALHIPDGFLSTPVAAAAWVVAIASVALAARQADRTLGERAVPVMGVMAAFIFAAQMMNFPVAGGTSGHMLGGALAAIMLGPWAAILVLTTVVGIQALVFQDGGLVVMGANILNMGVLTSLVGYAVYRGAQPLLGRSSGGRLVVAFVAAWVTVQVAALGTTAMLVISGTSPLSVALPAMLGVHALIGVGEGLITAAAVGFVVATRPDLLALSPAPSASPPSSSVEVRA